MGDKESTYMTSPPAGADPVAVWEHRLVALQLERADAQKRLEEIPGEIARALADGKATKALENEYNRLSVRLPAYEEARRILAQRVLPARGPDMEREIAELEGRIGELARQEAGIMAGRTEDQLGADERQQIGKLAGVVQSLDTKRRILQRRLDEMQALAEGEPGRDKAAPPARGG